MIQKNIALGLKNANSIRNFLARFASGALDRYNLVKSLIDTDLELRSSINFNLLTRL